MQITISRKVLADALNELAPLAGKNKALLVLNNVKFVTKGNKIRMQTSDADTTIRKYVDAEEIDQDGSFLVDCASLTAFVNKINGDRLTLVLNDNTLAVEHSKGKASFQALPPDDFHEVNMADESVSVILPAQDFAKLVSIARNFVSHDDYRMILRPIKAIVEGGRFTVCATDTRAMFTDSIELAGEAPAAAWTIEQSVFGMLVNACKDEESVTVTVSPRSVTYRIGTTTFYTSQTQGNYPDFNRVIPKSHKIEVKCDKNEVLNTISRASLFVEESNLVSVAVDETEMNIAVNNISKLKNMSEKVTCESNEQITLGVDVRILAECVKACAAANLTIELEDASHPIVFTDSDSPNRVVLCMPMRLVNP